MNDNELNFKIIGDAKPYIASLTEAMTANKKMQSEIETLYEIERREISAIRTEIRRLNTARNEATTAKDLQFYNKKLEESHKLLTESKNRVSDLKEEQKKLSKELKDSEKKQDSYFDKLLKGASIVAGAKLAWEGFKKVVNSTSDAASEFASTMAGVGAAINSALQSLATGDLSGMFSRMASEFKGAKEHEKVMAEYYDRMRSLEFKRIESAEELNELYVKMRAAVANKEYEEYQKHRKDYERISAELFDAEQRIQQARIESFEKNIIGSKMIRDKETLQLREATNEDIEIYKNYIKNYALLSDEEINNLNEALVTKKTVIAGIESIMAARTTVTSTGSYYNADLYKDEEINLRNTLKNAENALSEHTKIIYDNYDLINLFTKESRDEYAKILEDGLKADNRMSQLRKNLARMDIAAEKQANAERLQDQKEYNARKEADAMLTQQKAERLANEINRMLDENERKHIEKLEGLDKIDAERNYQTKQLEQLKTYLESLGQLNEDGLNALKEIEDRIKSEWIAKTEAYIATKKELEEREKANSIRIKQETADKIKAINEDTNKYLEDVEIARANMMDKTGLEAATIYYNRKVKEIKDLVELHREQINSDDEVTQAMAENTAARIDLAEYEAKQLNEVMLKTAMRTARKYVQSFAQAFGEIANMLQSTYNQQLQYYQKERNLMETRIGELQKMIEIEQRDREQGYASNVEAKKQELELLQQERDKALEKEAEIAEKQQVLNDIMQISNLVTSSSSIFAAYSAIPGGTAIAIALITIMLAAFAKAKIDAKKVAELGTGGSGDEYGIITGKKHTQGGENFLEHVKVEHGEAWGILASNKVPKYGKQFHEIVEAMNMGKFEMPKIIIPDKSNNSIIVNNDLSFFDNMEKAIKNVELAVKEQTQVFYANGKRIEKSKNSIRIINEQAS